MYDWGKVKIYLQRVIELGFTFLLFTDKSSDFSESSYCGCQKNCCCIKGISNGPKFILNHQLNLTNPFYHSF